MISTPILVNTTNRNLDDIPTARNVQVSSTSSSSNSDSEKICDGKNSDGNNTKTVHISKPRPWVDDEKAKKYREQFKQRKEEDEKRRASIDIIEIKPICETEQSKNIITVKVPPPRLSSEGNYPKKEDSLIDFDALESYYSPNSVDPPKQVSRNNPLNSSISTKPIQSLEELKMDNFTDDLLKTLNISDTTSTYDNASWGKSNLSNPQYNLPSSQKNPSSNTLLNFSHETRAISSSQPVPSARNLSNEKQQPIPKPRTNWVQFD